MPLREERRAAVRARHLRHEGGHRRRARWRCARCGRLDAAAAGASTMLWTTDEEIGSAHVARGDRGDGARAATPSSCSSRRCRAAPPRPAARACGEYRADRARRRRARRPRPGEGRERDSRAGAAQIVDVAALQDLDRGISVNVGRVAGGTRTNVDRRSGARRGRRAGADGGGRGDARPAAAALQRRPARHAAGAQGRRIERPPLERTPAGRPALRACAGRRAPASARSWARVGPAAGRTGISRPRSGFLH